MRRQELELKGRAYPRRDSEEGIGQRAAEEDRAAIGAAQQGDALSQDIPANPGLQDFGGAEGPPADPIGPIRSVSLPRPLLCLPRSKPAVSP